MSMSTGSAPPKVVMELVRAKAAEQIQICDAKCGYHSCFFESMSNEVLTLLTLTLTLPLIDSIFEQGLWLR